MVSVIVHPTCETHRTRLTALKENCSYEGISRTQTLGDCIIQGCRRSGHRQIPAELSPM